MGLRCAIALGLAAVAAGLVVVALVSTPWAQRRLLTEASAWIGARYGIELRAGRLDLGLRRLTVTLHDVTLAPIAAPAQATVRADRVDVDLSPRVLLGRLAAERIAIVRPVVVIDSHVRQLLGSRRAAASSAADEPSTPAFEIDQLEVQDLDLTLRDHRLPEMVARGVSARLRGTGPGRLDGTLVLAGGVGAPASGSPIAIDRLDAAVALDAATLTLRSLDARSPVGDVHVEGVVELAEAGHVDLRYRASASLERVQAWWPEAPALYGRIDLRGNIVGALRDAAVSFEARGASLGWASITGVRFDVSGRLASSASSHSTVRGTWSAPALGIGATADVDATGTLDLAWRGPLPSLTTMEGQVRAAPRMASGAEGPRGAFQLDGRAGQWRLQGRQPLAGASSAAIDLEIGLDAARPTQSAMTGTVALRTANAAGLLAQGRQLGIALPAFLDQVRGGRVSLEARVSGTVAAPRADGEVRADGLIVGSVDGIGAHGTVAADRRALSLMPLAIDAGGNRAEFRGDLPWTTPNGRGTFEAQIDRPAALPLRLPETWRLSGSLSVSGQWEGSIRRPVVSAHVRGSKLAAGGIAFESATGTVRASAGGLEARDLHFQQAGGFLRGHAAWDYLTSSVAIDARAEGLDLVVPAASDATADPSPRARLERASFDLRLEGPLERLAGSASLSASAVEVGGRGLGAVEASAEISDGAVRARAHASAHRAVAEVVVALTDPWAYDARIDLRDSDLRTLLLSAGTDPGGDVRGLVTVRIQAAGALAEWRRSALDVELRSVSGEARGRPLALSRPGRIRVQDRAVTLVEPARITAGALALDIAGADGPEAGIEVALEGPVQDVLALAAPHLPATGWVAEGRLRAGFLVGEPFDAATLKGDAAADLSAVTRNGQTLARSANLRAHVQDGTIQLSRLAGQVLDSDITASGAVPLAWLLPRAMNAASPARPSTTPVATLAVESTVAVGPMVAQLGPGIGDIFGTVRLRIDAQASAPRLDALRASASADVGEVSVRGMVIAQQAPTRLRLEDGRLHVEVFDWRGPRSRLTAVGSVGLIAGVENDLRVEGRSALLALDAILPGRAEGDATFDLRMSGPAGSRQVEGTIVLEEGSLLLPRERLAFAGWSGTLVLDAAGVSVSGLRGQFNGGEVTIDGRLPLVADAVAQRSLDLTIRNAFLEFPRGLRSQFDSVLTWRRAAGPPRLSGKITVTADTYREPITALASMVAGLRRASGGASAAVPAWLGSAELDVQLVTAGPVAMSNSAGRVDLLPDLTLSGTVSRPLLIGQVAIADDGRILIGGRSYRLLDSRVEFRAASGLVPRLNVTGETRVGDYTINLRLSGPADAIETSLTSDPPLSERDLQSLLVTGQTADSTVSGRTTEGFAIGAVSGDILGFAGQFIGLDSVRVGTYDDLKLVSSDVDPATRVTVSKRFGADFELILSDNLDDNELTWVLVYRPRPGYEFRLLSRDNLEYGLEFRQEVAFGPGVSPPRVTARQAPAREKVGPVTVSGSPGLAVSDVLAVTRLQEGDRFDFRAWLEDRDRIERLYMDRGHYAVRVVPSRTTVDGADATRRVALDYRILDGPRTVLQVIGYDAPAGLLDQLKEAWADSVLLDLLDDDLAKVAQDHLTDAGYLRARVEADVDAGVENVVTVRLRIEPGPRTSSRRLALTGNTAVPTDELLALLAAGRLDVVAWKDPAPLLDAIETEYASRGYPGARATAGAIEFANDTATMPIRIDEGPEARVTSLSVRGVAAGREATAASVLNLAIGSRYVTRAEQAARVRLERVYRSLGFRDVRVEATARVDAALGQVQLVFDVAEGPQYVVSAVRTSGARSTRAENVARAITLAPGSPASPDAAADTQRRLYRLGTFRAADVTFEPAGAPAPAGAATVPVEAVVSLQESRRFLLLYGLETTSEYEPAFDQRTTSLGAAADVRDRNFLGRGWALGAGARYERKFQSVRTLFSVPSLRGRAIRTSVYAALTREIDESAQGLRLRDDESVASIEQRWRPRGPVEVSWGYTLDLRDARLFTADGTRALFGFRGWLASVNAAVVFDHRDSMFDATRGWIQSTSAQWGLRALGSDFDYLRTLVRASHYQPLGPLTLASNVRWGNLEPLGGTPPLSAFDLFFDAGGSQTVRGYKQDSLSAYEVLGVRLGGSRLLLFNEELRFPLFWRLGGVIFGDAGNTFTDQGPLDLTNLAVGIGFGLRIRTPLAPLRLDIGFPVPRRPGDPLARWHFSIGQMF